MKNRLSMLVSFPAAIAVAALLTVVGCSDIRESRDLPSPSGSGLQVHPEGWTTTASAHFHGEEIRRLGWDMQSCQTCHGKNYAGGTSKVSCRTCHTETLGPEHCNVCHGSATTSHPPRDLSGNTDKSFRGVGEHQVHMMGTVRSRAAGCTDCHTYPTGSIYDTLHIGAAPDSRAEITLNSGLAARKTVGVTPTPTYYPESGACNNTYCHGSFRNGNADNPVFWNGGAALSVACGSCHGDVTRPTLAERALPRTSALGGTHPDNLACANCHGGTVDANITIIDPSRHMDGRLNLFGQDREF